MIREVFDFFYCSFTTIITTPCFNRINISGFISLIYFHFFTLYTKLIFLKLKSFTKNFLIYGHTAKLFVSSTGNRPQTQDQNLSKILLCFPCKIIRRNLGQISYLIALRFLRILGQIRSYSFFINILRNILMLQEF